MTVTRYMAKQRQRETELDRLNYESKQRQLRKAPLNFNICVTDGDFIFPERVGAESMEDAIAKVKKMAWRAWGFGDVALDKIRCTHAEEVAK